MHDIEVMADIGALAAEVGIPQPLKIDVSVTVVPPMADELSQAFDYCNIRRFALELASERIALIETFAYRLALMCLEHDAVLDAEVRILKPRAVPGCLAATRVKVDRRSDAGTYSPLAASPLTPHPPCAVRR